MGRNEQIAVRITPRVRAQLERIAEEEGETLSGLTWLALCDWLEDRQDEDSISGRANRAVFALQDVLWEDEVLDRAGVNAGVLEAAVDELEELADVGWELELELQEEESQEELPL